MTIEVLQFSERRRLLTSRNLFGAFAYLRTVLRQANAATFFLLLNLFGHGLAQAEVPESTAKDLLQKSGYWDQVGDIAPQVQDSFAQMMGSVGQKPSETELARAKKVLSNAFDPDRMRAVSLRIVSQKLSAKHVDALNRWYNTTLGQTITQLEKDASKQFGDPREIMTQGAEALSKVTKERRRLLEQLSKATQAAESLTQIVINSAIASHRGVVAAMPNAKLISEGELRRALEGNRAQLLSMNTAMTLAGFAKTYESLTQDNLRAYINFLRSEAGARFNALSSEALDAAMSEASNEVGRRLQSTKDQANS